MMPRAARLAAAALLLGAGVAAHAAATQPVGLRVCLDRNNGLNSTQRGRDAGSGFDLAMAHAVARRLGRRLAVRWFSYDEDLDAVPAREVNALLSAGVCDLVGGYALGADSLGKPNVREARVPAYEAAGKSSPRRRAVALGVLAPSHAYRRSALTVVLGPGVAMRRITRLSDLSGLKLGCENDTLSCAILMRYAGGRLSSRVVHVLPGAGILRRLQEGAYQAVLVELGRLDAYRAAHPHSGLQATGYYHSLAFNIGFVALERKSDLLYKVDAAVDRMLAAGEVEALAERARLTYVAPRAPLVESEVMPADLLGD
jgi:ABC-type amino acid transport substrate-binding protein